MIHWTEERLQEELAKQRLNPSPNDFSDKASPDPGPESSLASKIVSWAKQKNYPCLFLRQSQRAQGFIERGWPDIVLALPECVTVYLELKSKGGRLSQKQKDMARALLYLGHYWFEVRSWRKFLEIVEKVKG